MMVDLEYILKLIYETGQIQMMLVDAEGQLTYAYPYCLAVHPLYTDANQVCSFLKAFTDSEQESGLIATGTREHYAYLRLRASHEKPSLLLIGPILTGPPPEAEVSAMLNRHRLPKRELPRWIAYYRSLPVADFSRLLSLCQLVSYTLNGQKIDPLTHWLQSKEDLSHAVEREWSVQLTENREKGYYHHSFAAQTAIFECVRDGDPDRLHSIWNGSMNGRMGVLSSNHLRHEKNIGICGAALATRFAVEGGMDSETAFTLSDTYIQKLESLNGVREVAVLRLQMLADFAEKVREVKLSRYSYLVVRCQAHLKRQLYNEKPLSNIDKVLGLNLNYVSEVFKRETGITMSEFIQQEKIKEAKRLLEGDQSLLHISQALAFCDQSHFTRIFKKHTDLTPKQYRSKQRAEETVAVPFEPLSDERN